MGLLKEFDMGNGLQPVENAYHRIETISGTKNSLCITVSTYASQQIAIPGTTPLMQKGHIFTPGLDNPSNFIKQGYEYLKTIPEFAGAIDV